MTDYGVRPPLFAGGIAPKSPPAAKIRGALAPPTRLGETFDPTRDSQRLRTQYERVEALMADGQWRTLRDITAATGAPEASASARLRDMRRAGWVVEERRVEGAPGLHIYRAGRAGAP